MEKELSLALLKELFDSVTELHQEYSDNTTSYVIDALKEDNTMKITISLKENKDKEEFENFVNTLDDDLFEEVLESLKGKISDLNEVYESENYREVIDSFKERVKEIAQEKINYLKTLL